jgi:glyoxylase-like metal-dependent hydrolase (beta-lactamase superfamily II)
VRTIRIAEPGDGLIAFVHGDGSLGLANAVAIVDGRTATVVDAMLLPRMAAGVREELARRGVRPELILNTHHHADHVGGNGAFPDVRVAAHPVSAGIVRRMAGRTHELGRIMPAFAGELADLELRPPEPTALDHDLPRGARLLVFTAAHSPADLAVWLPDQRVLLAGDLCFNRVVPLAVQGLLSGWLAALDEVFALGPLTVVPGHGPVADMDDVRALRDYLASVLAAGRSVATGLVSEPEAAELVDTRPVEGWVEPERTALNLRRAVQEARGEIDATRLM